MKNNLKGFKHNIGYFIWGIVLIIFSIALSFGMYGLIQIVPDVSEFFNSLGEIGSILLSSLIVIPLLLGIIFIIATFSAAKDYGKTHCDNCGKLITGCAYTVEPVSYNVQTDNMGRSTYKVNYIVTTECPFCGSSDTWTGHSSGNTMEIALANARKNVDRLYRRTTSDYGDFIDAIKQIPSGTEFVIDEKFVASNYLQLKPKQFIKYTKKFHKQYKKYATLTPKNTYIKN